MTPPHTAGNPPRLPLVAPAGTLDTKCIRPICGPPRPATPPRGYRIYRLLRRQHFDLAVSLCGLMASIWAFLSGATHRLGYRKEAYPLLHTHTLLGRRYDRCQHEVRWCLDLAEEAGAARRPRYLH